MKNIFEEYNQRLYYANKANNYEDSKNLKNYYYDRACCFEAFYMYKDALENIDKAIEFYNDNTETNNVTKYMCFINKGVVLTKMEKYEEAMNIFEKAIKIEPDNPMGYVNKIASLGVLKNMKKLLNFVKKMKK